MKRWWSVMSTVALVLGLAGLAQAQTIKVGSLNDLTGVTSEVGKDYAAGIRSAVDWINEQGGVNGRKIELILTDYGYKIPQAVATYKKYVEQDKVIMIQGWGTGDTEALRESVNKDKIPFMSASYSSHLNDPTGIGPKKFGTPYNFYVGTSYSDQIRIFLKWVKDNWKDSSRKAKVAFIYADNPYGKAPIEAGRAYAKELGLDLVDEAIVPSSFQDSTSQLLNMQKANPDFAYINTTTGWVAVILKDAFKLGIKTKFVINNWGYDENLPRIAKEAAEGVYGMAPFAMFGDDVPGMKKIVDAHQKHHPGDTHIVRHVQAWVSVLAMAEGMKRALDQFKELNADTFKKGLETLKNFDTGGLSSPITVTAEDHRPNTRLKIYVVKGGKLEPATDWIEIERKKDWLGW